MTFAKSLNFISLSTVLVLSLGILPGSGFATEPREQDHQEISQVRDLGIAALNSRDFSKIEAYLHPNFTITTVDNRIFRNVKEFEQYWKQQFEGPIQSIDFKLTVDGPTTFLSEETGVAYGDSTAIFSFKDGNINTMPMRWSAVMEKYQGKWTLQTIHFSASLIDNPVLKTTQSVGTIFTIGSGIGGLIIGGLIGSLLLRRKPQSTQPTV